MKHLLRLLRGIGRYVKDLLLLFFPTDKSVEEGERYMDEWKRTGKDPG